MRSRSGFTLVELMVVVVVVGILGTMAMPRFNNTKGRANFTAIKADLRNLALAEEAYFVDHSHYTAALDSMRVKLSPGVVLSVVEATNGGWSATAYHPSSWPRTCAIFFGSAAVVAPASAQGVVGCN
jgi:prepilin-type N-terminal cleavage/methylation domain-containing protein